MLCYAALYGRRPNSLQSGRSLSWLLLLLSSLLISRSITIITMIIFWLAEPGPRPAHVQWANSPLQVWETWVDTLQRGVQWMGGAVDWNSIIMENSI